MSFYTYTKCKYFPSELISQTPWFFFHLWSAPFKKNLLDLEFVFFDSMYITFVNFHFKHTICTRTCFESVSKLFFDTCETADTGTLDWLKWLRNMSCPPNHLQVRVYPLGQYEHGADDVLVLGTDGLWDVLSNQEVAEAVTCFLANCDPDDQHRHVYSSHSCRHQSGLNFLSPRLIWRGWTVLSCCNYANFQTFR